MVLQSVVYPNNVCKNFELYYRNIELLLYDEKTVVLPAGNRVSFLAYMNCFDIDMWKKYTCIQVVSLRLGVKGKGRIYLKCRNKYKDIDISYIDFDEENILTYKDLELDIDLDTFSGLCYFEIVGDTDVTIYNARFETNHSYVSQEVHLALNICTYHRNVDITRNIEMLKSSEFFSEKSDLYQKLSIVIVDNGSELEEKEESNYKLIRNRNTGGAGGFSRGLCEIRKWKNGISHTIFMDDDVMFINEAFYRLYALLSYLKKKYHYESVAGRMFSLNEPHIQYTAAEIWNKGYIEHIGFNQDMTKEDYLLLMNSNKKAEYGGWWFCCYPMSFVKDNEPLPFFIHCDDVEYGLRHGGEPIILNGIQVWHETYVYRDSDIIQYYDMRNMLFVNEIYEKKYHNDVFLYEWKSKITMQHNLKNYTREYMLIRGVYDFCKGIDWLYKVNAERLNKKLKVIKSGRIRNAIMWRLSEFMYKKYLRKIKEKTNE